VTPPEGPDAAALRRELIGMVDEEARAALEAAGAGGYPPALDIVHRRNARRLLELIERHGWPARDIAGDDGARAAWRIAQHAIGEPDAMRGALVSLRESAAAGRAPAWQPAMLEDRILTFEGRPQRFGTQFEPDGDGLPRPFPIEDPEGVEPRRRAAGLGPLAVDVARRREAARARAPHAVDRETFERDFDAWARSAGWRR
jgi:hypothetical protein